MLHEDQAVVTVKLRYRKKGAIFQTVHLTYVKLPKDEAVELFKKYQIELSQKDQVIDS